MKFTPLEEYKFERVAKKSLWYLRNENETKPGETE